MKFHSRSQAGQDLLVYRLLVQPAGSAPGLFLDVGASHPIEKNNTYELEQCGWTGWLLDNDANAADLCRQHRTSKVVCADATTFDYATLTDGTMRTIDYLSLDCDASSLAAVQAILKAPLIFRVITIEHDKYRFSGEMQRQTQQLLRAAGYELICEDVCDMDLPFEDWWIQPYRVDVAIAYSLRSVGKNWQEIVGVA